MASALENQQLHFILVPMMAQGHMIPMIDIAKLLACQGVIATIVTTHHNALRHKALIDRARANGLPIQLLQLRFPTREVGLPDGCESIDALPSRDYALRFFAAADMLQQPLEDLIAEMNPRPNCIISDFILAWTSVVATKFQIPRIIFHGISCFTLLSVHNLRRSGLHESVSSDDEPFFIPNFPHQIEITRNKLPGMLKESHGDIMAPLRRRIREGEESAYGVLINSFNELEAKYYELFKETKHGKAWCIGPVSLCNKDELDLVDRGNKASIDKNKCLEWLDLREPKSVIYFCLGSMNSLTVQQLIEIGLALEASDHPFVWVIKGGESNEEFRNWLSEEGFEERNKERGMLIKGWAPQVLILSHWAVGGFLTHCGWNSTLEGLCAGVPMVTWPMFGEQFLNEKVIVEVLRVGYRVGVDVFVDWGVESKVEFLVGKENIERSVRRLMDKSSEECEEMRRRVEEIGEMGRRAMEDGGSSHFNLSLFIQDIVDQMSKKNT
ncbi:hypothetical protein Syun_000674 [Stephania yunnanensis]|uniref:Glycosyltransferase n=1 Tax=Stephania yunnanensis TaxID=152371 RepID=A0AAP0Q701_9MAGN